MSGIAVEERTLEGDPVGGLVRAVEESGGTLLAVGSHGTSRAGGIIAGSVATAIAHHPRCSVVIARVPTPGRRVASKVAVGVDGSASSLRALAVAQLAADRIGAALLPVSARGAALDLADLPAETAAGLRIDERDPVTALLAAADESDLLVVGARGLSGLRALGSVSERVAHRAPVSVLVAYEGEGA